MSLGRKMVLIAATALFALWVILHFGRLTGDPDGMIRWVLGMLFALLLLFRWKTVQQGEPSVPAVRWAIPVSAVLGALLVVVGIVFRVRQFEWLGLILILYACLRWALPDKFAPDIGRALFLVYWIHPLPGQVFGKLQLIMQILSVQGAEWCLQTLNVRVWADGFILHTGFRTFGVPESCSGMRTVVTVLLSTLGVGLLLRFRWWEMTVLLALGLVQVLALNVVRIVLMVVWAVRMPPEWGKTFLHDTLGIFLLISILLVQAQASWWKFASLRRQHRKLGIERGELERPDQGTTLPGFWRRLFKWGWLALLVLLAVGGAALGLYKHRPEHRAAMVSEVADDLAKSDLGAAERAVDAALALTPGDRTLRTKRVAVLVMRGKYEEALRECASLAEPLSTYEVVLKGSSLMALGRASEAVALVFALPESDRARPSVAMILAEYAAFNDRPEDVVKNLALAARTHLTVKRVRALFPYLAAREQWRAIVQSDNRFAPHADPIQAAVAVQANLKMNRLPEAGRIVKYAIRKWPNDPRFLGGLFSLALNQPGTEWESAFEETLRATIPSMGADRLAACISDGFRLGRPDLAWQIYRTLQERDPRDPFLYLEVARFGDVWFSFRRRHLGLEAESADVRLDLRPLYLYTKRLDPFASFWSRAPVAGELSGGMTAAIRRKYVERFLAEAGRRTAEGRTSKRVDMAVPIALAMIGRYPDALAESEKLAAEYPEEKQSILMQQAMFHDQTDRWQDLYETLARTPAAKDYLDLSTDLLLIKALMNLNLGVCAMEIAERARQAIPGAAALDLAAAAIWDFFGFKEQAFFTLGGDDPTVYSRNVVQLMYDTGRYKEAERIARSMGVPIRRDGLMQEQPLVPMMAEMSIGRNWSPPLAREDMRREADRVETNELRLATSPFIRKLLDLTVDWYRQGGAGECSDPGRWQAIGRDDLEQAAALHRLTILLARQARYEDAEKVVEKALALLPASVVLHRIRVALTQGRASALEGARKACPNDPEIWLASLVARARDEGPGAWAIQEVNAVAGKNRFSVETMVRAGDFLLRNGMKEAADVAARDAVRRCRGYLPAYVLALRCGVATKDVAWALSCALGGVDNAVDPAPFYKVVVELKSAGKNTDGDLVRALEFLKDRFPAVKEWSERLAQAHFERGDPGRALNVLESVVNSRNVWDVSFESLLLASEAARLGGARQKALDFLGQAYREHPDDPAMLNNLVYTLAQEPATLARARDLLPRLLHQETNSFAVLDTIAMVYFKSGEIEKAREYMDRALKGVDRSHYAAPEVSLNAGRILLRVGEIKRAEECLRDVLRYQDRSDLVDRETRALLSEIAAKKARR